MKYRALLDRSYAEQKEEFSAARNSYSVGEYLSDYIFDFTTYCGGISEYFSEIAIDVVEAITERKTFDFIKDDDKHIWFIVMCNMDFFSSKISWGCSVRGAWWDVYDHNPIKIDSCGLYNENLEQIDIIEFNEEEWEEFCRDLVCFYRDNQNATK